MAAPPFLLDKPVPIPKQRLYNGRKLMVWEGKVNISSIQGWVDNPRIELAKKELHSRIGPRSLRQEEIFDLMKTDPDVKLAELRDDIIKNGLREPLTLSFNGTLLDGNRRFFALKYALATMGDAYPNKQDLQLVDAYVLSDDATKEDEHFVLVEENFSASLKLEWPAYVKAGKIVDASQEGLSIDEISKKFDWDKTKIRNTLKIYENISDFINFATQPIDLEDENGGGLNLSENEAERIAAKSYQYFNEAQKSFSEPLKTNFPFKIQFFKWIAQGKFESFPEVRIAHQAWNNPEALAALMQPEPTAAKAAKAIIEYNMRVSRSTEEAAGRIDTFVRFLHDMSAKEIKALPQMSRDKLEEALRMIIKMTKAAAAE